MAVLFFNIPGDCRVSGELQSTQFQERIHYCNLYKQTSTSEQTLLNPAQTPSTSPTSSPARPTCWRRERERAIAEKGFSLSATLPNLSLQSLPAKVVQNSWPFVVLILN